MNGHTPRPWRLLEAGRTESPGNKSRPLTIAGPGDDDLANVYSRDDATVSIPRAEAIANARLMAAAPELLRALEGIRVELHVAQRQRSPSDDRIIAEHIDAALETAKDALRLVR